MSAELPYPFRGRNIASVRYSRKDGPRHWIVLTFLATSLTAAAAAQGTNLTPELRDAIGRVEEMTALELAKENVGSVTVGVVSGAKLVWTKSFGLADMERSVLATERSVYRIGSITKQFGGLMLLQLVERGKVRLSDPVEKYFPEIERVTGAVPDAPPVTLVQLATMTSGLAREPEDLPSFLVGPVSEWDEVLVSAIPRVSFQYEPDTRFLYSNIGYAILGAALSRAADQPFDDYVTDNFFEPLGMADTAFEPNERIRERIAKGYELDDDGRLDSERPAAGACGTGLQSSRGSDLHHRGRPRQVHLVPAGGRPEDVLTHEALADNFSRVSSATGDLTSGYGVGFRVRRDGELIILGARRLGRGLSRGCLLRSVVTHRCRRAQKRRRTVQRLGARVPCASGGRGRNGSRRALAVSARRSAAPIRRGCSRSRR